MITMMCEGCLQCCSSQINHAICLLVFCAHHVPSGYTAPEDFDEEIIRAAALSQDTPQPRPSGKRLPVTVRAVLIMMLELDYRKRIGSKEVIYTMRYISHMSHVACHMLHVTHHTSQVTRHTSHVTPPGP